MELSELQKRVDAWIREYGVRYFSELTNMAILTEDAEKTKNTDRCAIE